ncbi:MAG: hypothetical protein K8I02_06655, partial [Candidatus Methylomirabilis sp.]|nr:hypothetical protein [Deltaproteobacteria bacterium]
LLESDLTVYVNVTLSPMNGGWKSTVVGLSSFRSIRGHHRPFPFSSGKSIMDPKRSSFQKILGEMGGVLRAEMARRGARLFQLEATVNNSLPSEIIGVHGGEVEAVHARTLAAMSEQVVVDVDGQTDVMVIGLPNADPYSQLSRINPLLVVNLGCAYTFGLYEVAPTVREGGVLILANPFQHQFNALHHPSYIEFFDVLLRRTRDPFELWDSYVDDFARRPEYLHAYRHGYAFHGAHPFFMWNSTVTPRRHCAAIFAAGVEDRRVTERLGLPSFWRVEDAIAAAGALLGKTSPTVTFLPIPPLSVTRLRGA